MCVCVCVCVCVCEEQRIHVYLYIYIYMYATHPLQALHFPLRVIILCNTKLIIDNFHHPFLHLYSLEFPFSLFIRIIVTSDII